MRLVFALLHLIIILPFTPVIFFILILSSMDWEDFKEELAELYWSY